MKACTVVARNYVPYARVLAASYAGHHHGERPAVLVIDDHSEEVRSADEPFDVVRPGELGLETDELRALEAIYDAKELATALKPSLLRLLLREHDAVLFLDPDVEVFAELSAAADLVHEHAIVLVPHARRPFPADGRTPTERHLRRTGVYNGGFLGVGDGAEPFLEWWHQRLRRDCVFDRHEGLFVDQRWLDLVPAFFAHHLLRHPGFNVAYWNLHERRVERVGTGYTVEGEPLRTFHFSGFDAHDPRRLTRVADRISLEREPALRSLCEAYARHLREAGYEEWIGRPYTRPDGRPSAPLRERRLRRELLLAHEPDGDGDVLATLVGQPMDEMAVPAERRARAYLATGPDADDTPAPRRATRAARLLVMRLLRTFTVHQRRVDESLLDAIQETREGVERELTVLRERVEALEARVERPGE